MRIATLLPSATEIVCAIGASDALVGRSHECDFPVADVADVPMLTRSQAFPAGSAAIDAAVRDTVDRGLAIYSVDYAALREARPDVIVTQDLCAVCALPAAAIEQAVHDVLEHDVQLVRLSPRRLAHVLEDIERVGEAIGHGHGAMRLTKALRQRLEHLRATAGKAARFPTVLTIEWLDPVMIGGLWTPELVTIAGGQPLIGEPGTGAPTLGPDALAALDPDVVIVKPCGFTTDMTRDELATLNAMVPEHWRARDAQSIYVVDGSAYFNRSGPRLVDSAQLLAGLLHPGIFPDLAGLYAPGVLRLARDGSLVAL